jgi:DNA helicase-2/ATP-dependent DNA helicase PcrA
MKLNEAQKQAVEAIEGPVMVIAGPGTGKTQITAERIAEILSKTDTPPHGILALTFTESGAKAMRERLLSTIGETAYYVNIFTFHAFCSSVIQEFPDRFIIANESEPLSGLERVEIFHELLTSLDLTILRPANQPFYYTGALTKAIQDLKREAITPSALNRHLNKDDLKNKELVAVFKAYQQILKERGRYDFEDMINLVVEAFKADEELLRTYQERLLYFLVDEFQDTNSAQNQVVELLSSYWGDQANVFVVGDSDQSVFRFQGASLENIIGFRERYPKAKIIALNKNYRSTQTILDASYHLIQKNSLKIEDVVEKAKPKLKAQALYKERPLIAVNLPSALLENFWLADKIQSLLRQGVKAEEIAVLYRHNADAAEIAEMFAKFAIPTNIEGGSNVLTDPAINKLLMLFKAVSATVKNLEDLELFNLMHYEFFDFDPLDVLKVSRAAASQKTSIMDLIASPNINQLGLTDKDKFKHFLKKLSQWQQLDARLTFSEFFETILEESGFLNWVLSLPTAVEKLNRLNSLFAEVKRLNQANHQLNLNSFLQSLELMELNSLNISEQDLDITTAAVTLTTAHRAKGKEWEYVFIVKAIDGKWGNNRTRELIKLPQNLLKNAKLDKKEKNEDERRLFYVSLTRAKKQLYLTYAERYASGTHLKEAVPSMFLSQLPEKMVKTLTPEDLTQKAKTALTKFLAPVSDVPTIEEKDFLSSLLKDFKLSPTALNTYLTCAYKFKLNNLIKVPRAKLPYLAFGTAAHKALENFHRKLITGKTRPSKKYLLSQFEQAISQEVMTKNELKRRMSQGKTILSAYYDYYRDQFAAPLFVEKFFGGSFSKVMLEDIPLSGKVDRIDVASASDKTVRLVDYKTGAPQSRNAIMGKTKASNGDYYLQLVFYKLLAELDRTFKSEASELTIDFVQPNKSGKFKKEMFKVSSKEVDELKTTIKAVMKEIRSLNFSRTTNYEHCVTCEFRQHCWPEGIPVKAQSLRQ